MAETRSFQEMLADKEVENAGITEARRRAAEAPGQQIVRRLGVGGAALGYGPEWSDDAAKALRIQRAARAREFLAACGVVANNMGKYGKPPIPSVELRSPMPIFGTKYGTGWMLLQHRHPPIPAIKARPSDGRDSAVRPAPPVRAYTEGVLLDMNGTPIAFSGLPVHNGRLRYRGEPIEAQWIGDMNVRELGVPVLANSAVHDVELYMGKLVDLAFTNGVTAEQVATGLHQAQQ